MRAPVAFAASLFVFLAASSLARAQTLPIDPEQCSLPPNPICVPTATCSEFGNDPAIYDPANVSQAPTCAGGQLLSSFTDADGTQRYACLWEPPQASIANPLPLLVFIHPSLFPADTVELATDLVAQFATGDLTGDPARPGYIVLAPQGRTTCHYYPVPDDIGLGWDNWYRNLDPSDPVQNVDVATIDHFIAEQVATGKVDPLRIYISGWSNGAAMGYLYALHRPQIAAAAVYSSPDPFRTFNDPCPQVPVAGPPSSIGEIQIPNLGVPTYHVHNDCDIAGICPVGERLEGSLAAIGVTAEHTLINSLMLPANQCLDLCGTDPNGDLAPCENLPGYTLGVANHGRWPLLYTTAMLEFLRDHPLNGGALPLAVLKAKVRGQKGGGGNGVATAVASFTNDDAPDAVDAAAPVSVSVRDSLGLDSSHSFASGECISKPNGLLRCRSADRSVVATVKPKPAGSTQYRYKLRMKNLAVDGPFAGPVRIGLGYGATPIERAGMLSSCRSKASGIACR